MLVAREDVEQLLLQGAAAQHAIREVRTIERSDEHQGIAQPQLRHDVASHPLGGGCGERMERHAGKIVAQASELAIFRTEVVPPLADAVRLVDRDEADAGGREHPAQRLASLGHDPLGRDVQQPAPAVAHARQHAVALVRQQRAVQVGRRDPIGTQAVDLIFHQRYERRDDQRNADAPLPVDDCRRLKAQRLATAGREHDNAIARGEDCMHRLALQ